MGVPELRVVEGLVGRLAFILALSADLLSLRALKKYG
jgi:hypothetical protein